MNIKSQGHIENLIATIKQQAGCGPIQRQDALQLTDKAWDAVIEYMERYIFPFDEPYVNQTKMATSIHAVCSNYGRPDLAPWVQLFIYAAWRKLFLTYPWMIYCNTKFADKPKLHIACCHDETCGQVSGYAYSSCTAQVGDAIRFADIQKPTVPNQAGQSVLDSVWLQLVHDEELPQGNINHMDILEDVVSLLEIALKTGEPLTIDAGLSELKSSISFLGNDKYQGTDTWKQFQPDDALLLISHTILLEATVGYKDDLSLNYRDQAQ